MVQFGMTLSTSTISILFAGRRGCLEEIPHYRGKVKEEKYEEVIDSPQQEVIFQFHQTGEELSAE